MRLVGMIIVDGSILDGGWGMLFGYFSRGDARNFGLLDLKGVVE